MVLGRPLSRFPVGSAWRMCLANVSGTLWTHGPTNVAGISRFGRKVDRHSGLCEFHRRAHFVVKSYAVNSSQKYLLCTFSLGIVFCRTLPDFHGHSWGSEQRPIKNGQFCVIWKLPFCDHWTINLTQTCVCFANSCIKLLLRHPSLVNATPRYSNFSTCCTVLRLSCSAHCRGFVKRHNTSECLVLISIHWWSHTGANDQVDVADLARKIQAVPNCPQNGNSWSCSFKQCHLRRLGCKCLSNSYRLCRAVVTAPTLVGVLHPQ